MRLLYRFLTLCLFLQAASLFGQTDLPPSPFGPLPSERQLAWHEMEQYLFVHFNMNTFTNMEWGYGNEHPNQFNPTNLDTRQWARIARDAGMKGIILTAKHHDGFCLWPSAFTDHSVKNSSWKKGEGDVVQDLADACAEYGLKMGLYLSPWDRNHPDYGRPEYLDVFHGQLRELLTQYGELFEVWFDGANGGDGFYGGARETRKIDNKTYYQWDKVHAIVRELQPNACIFGDGGPDVRWVGNEEGWANKTNWSLLRKKEVYPGYSKYIELRSGHPDGTDWVPAECDVSIRPGWYFHPYEDHQVKSLSKLMNIYYESVGRNANLLLNIPVDTRGLIAPQDSARLLEFGRAIQEDFKDNVGANKPVIASVERGPNFRASNVTDQNPETYWAAPDTERTAELSLDLGEPIWINRLVLQEYIPLGQRINAFVVEARVGQKWIHIDSGTTVGYKRIFRFPLIQADQVRLRILDARACPVLSNIAVYQAPVLLEAPQIQRNKMGMVQIKAADPDGQVFYTVDGSAPDVNSMQYSEPFAFPNPGIIQAIEWDSKHAKHSAVERAELGKAKTNWKAVYVSEGAVVEAAEVVDEDPWTVFDSGPAGLPFELVLDLGEVLSVKGFRCLPMQQRWFHSLPVKFACFISRDGKEWETMTLDGRFSNIVNNPIWQNVYFNDTKGARYMMLQIHESTDSEQKRVTLAELDMILSGQ
jgi:alpha-L-fucosidase